jgi:tRNA modification GTPase
MTTLDLECKDTIAALLTGSGDGVINVVRISGAAAVDVRDRVFVKHKGGPHKNGVMHLGHANCAGVPMEALCVTFGGTRTFTGEPCVELHGMGGRINAARLLDAVLGGGARQAMPGEFSLRAFLHGRLSLDQAEAVAALLTAQSTQAAVAATRLREGVLARALEPLRESVLSLLAETEAYLDFPDDGLPPQRVAAQRAMALDVADSLHSLLRGHERTRRMLEGARVVLWGAPNAGKSTLLNVLCGEARAIVDEVPGTTRDVVEAHVLWGGMPITLLDTAGVRDATGRVEQEGIRRSQEAAAKADLVLYCISADTRSESLLDPPAGVPVLVVETKGDLASKWGAAPAAARHLGTESLTVSALVGEGMETLRARMEDRLGGMRPDGDVVTATARQGELLTLAAEGLKAAMAARDVRDPEEVIAEHLRQAARCLGEVSGRAMPPEEVLGVIFSRFCIGK